MWGGVGSGRRPLLVPDSYVDPTRRLAQCPLDVWAPPPPPSAPSPKPPPSPPSPPGSHGGHGPGLALGSDQLGGGRGHTPARPAWPARAAAAAFCAQPRRTRRTCANSPSSSPLAPSRRWRRRRLAAAGGDSSARRHELWPSPKGQLTAGIGQRSHPLAVASPPRVWAGSDQSLARPAAVHSTRSASAHVALALSCRCTLWRRWCNAPGQWAGRAAGAPLATRCASCSGAVDAAGGGESTADGLAWQPFASGPGTSADMAGCSLDQQRVGSARCAVRKADGAPARGPGVGRWDAVGRAWRNWVHSDKNSRRAVKANRPCLPHENPSTSGPNPLSVTTKCDH